MAHLGSRALPLLALLPALAGCTWVGTVEGGAVTSPVGRAGRTGGAIGAHAAMGEGQVLPGVGVNAKVTRDVVSVGPAAELTVLFLDRTQIIEPFLSAGLTPLALGSADGRFTTSVVSPRARFGVYIPFGELATGRVTLRGPFSFVVSGFAEYDVRATGAASEAFVGATLGVGYLYQAFLPREGG